MTATSLHFGPEWMRNKQQTTPSATRPPASVLSPALPSISPPAPGASSYSSLLTPVMPAPPEKQDSVNPFKYSKEELLQVWKDGGGRGGLGLEVELWEGVVRELGGEPIGLKEMSEGERKLFSLPLNSDLRRRQSHDFLPNLSLSADRPKLSHSGSSTHSPLGQQRFSALLARKRKEDGTDGGPPLSLPRRLSLSSIASPLGAPLSPTGGALPSPRNRLGSGSHGLDGVAIPGDGSWRKRESDHARAGGALGDPHPVEERDEDAGTDGDASGIDASGSFNEADISYSTSGRSMAPSPPSFRDDSGGRHGATDDLTGTFSSLALLDEGNESNNTSDINSNNTDTRGTPVIKSGLSAARPPGLEDDPSNVSWSYRDPKGNIQGPFTATLMQKWYDEGYFTPDLLMKRTHLDTDWTPVGELSLRAGNEKLFFSSFSEHGPPGLAPRPSVPLLDSQTFDRFGQSSGQGISIQPSHPSAEHFTNGSPLSHFRNPVATRTSTLDSYLGSSSNPSHSPASSFNAGIIPIPSASPDPPFGAAGGRTTFGNSGNEPAFGGRVGGFEPQSSSSGARSGSVGFGATSDPPYGPRLASLGHRGSMFETQGFNSLSSVAPTSPWAAGGGGGGGGSIPRNIETDGLANIHIHRASLNNGVFGDSPVTNVPGFGELGSQDSTPFGSEAYDMPNASFSQLNRGAPSSESLASGFGPIGPGGLRDQGLRPLQDLESGHINSRHGMDEHSLGASDFGNGFGISTTSGVHGQGSVFGVHGNQAIPQQPPPQHIQQPPQHLPPNTTFSQSPAAPPPSSPGTALQSQQPQQQLTPNVPVTHPPWGLPPSSAQPRPRPFDAPHPTSRNVVRTPIAAGETPSYNRPQGQLESSEWYNTSKPEVDDGWGDISRTQQPSPANQSLDTSQGQQTAWNLPPRTSPAPFDRGTEQTSGHAPRSTPTPPQPQSRDSVPKKRGSTPQTSQSAASKPSVAAPSTPAALAPKSPSPLPTTTTTQTKPAWSTPALSIDDEAKATKQAGLREIQEAEAKKAEARKIAERERERAARANPQEETQPTQTYTASWGLPTSQAGAARSAPKEQTATPSLSAAPVWTNAVKPPQTKRTMKEIQEEEERRKKAATKDKETAAAAARRAYADSANKVTPGPPVGGVWTTVGSGGKASSGSPAPRQVSGSGQSTPSSQTPARPVNGNTLTRTSSASPQIIKSSASRPAPVEDGPVPPSPDFMKWLREAVRGFNAGFNTEEFMAMLLTFSLDFPPSTVEVIQDMVYMNSATLDGRRFAAEFCAKRKADAANRPKGWVTAGGKQPSLADVVKTQPKPAQSELPFKMVKKKGRGNGFR